MDKVSVIIPTFNRQDTLLRAVNSALQQTFPVHEILVCDDGSDDDSQNIICALNNPKIKWISCGRNGMPSVPRNMGIKASTGNWIAFLDSDDEWLPNKIETQMLSLNKSQFKAACSNAFKIVAGKNTGNYVFYDKETICLSDLFPTNPIICSSVIIHRDHFKKDILFPEEPEYKAIEDYALWLKISISTPFLYLQKPLINYTDSPDTSLRKNDSDVWIQRKIIFSGFKIWLKQNKIKLSAHDSKNLKTTYKIILQKGGPPLSSRIKVLLKKLLSMKENRSRNISERNNIL